MGRVEEEKSVRMNEVHCPNRNGRGEGQRATARALHQSPFIGRIYRMKPRPSGAEEQQCGNMEMSRSAHRCPALRQSEKHGNL